MQIESGYWVIFLANPAGLFPSYGFGEVIEARVRNVTLRDVKPSVVGCHNICRAYSSASEASAAFAAIEAARQEYIAERSLAWDKAAKRIDEILAR